MTPSDVLARGRALARSWWAVPLLALLVVLLLATAWNGQRRARTDAERAAEAAELARAGLAVAADRTERELRADLARAAGRSADLESELARVRAASPGARPVIVVNGSTGARPAGGPPRAPCSCSPATPPAGCLAGGAAAPPAQPPPGVPAVAGCLLSTGDQGEVRLEAAALRTPAGNLVVVGAAEAWRVQPGPPARLFGGPLELDVSAAPPARPLGWGVGVVATAGRAGWSAGPALSPPPLRFWGLQLEALAGAGVGPTGEWSATAAGLVRW